MTFTAIGIARHRIGSDGVGVTTLVGGYGCPLRCKYCLNPQCMRTGAEKRTSEYTIESLYERLRTDALYFEATGGGVTFGGGGPLLQAEFIAEFIKYTRDHGDHWRFSLETSLAVDTEKLETVLPFIDEFIVDVKDMNGEIYRAYTEREPDRMMANLAVLAKACPEKVHVKTPLIHEYNTPKEVLSSQIVLEGMGFSRIERLRYRTDVKK